MNLSLKAKKKIIKQVAYMRYKEDLNSIPLDLLTVDAAYADIMQGGKLDTAMAQLKLTEADMKEVLADIVPKLRKEKMEKLQKQGVMA